MTVAGALSDYGYSGIISKEVVAIREITICLEISDESLVKGGHYANVY
jgi:hypothetical protein